MYTGPKLTNNNLVFGYDTGYGVADNAVTTRFYQGEPTETFSIGSMLPTDPTASFVSNSTYHSNLAGSAWDWSYYPNSNISSDGGMEWRPEIQGPTFTGAWLMKKRAGGNGESNFSGNAPGSITSSAAYTVSVWVKTDQASCFRIHLNTTKNGSSYWGYASSYHSGGNEWERLSLTLPANSGNTAINTIRFQAVGSSVNADAYCRDYQVEKRGQATPFILGGTRSDTASLIDLKKTVDIDMDTVSFDSTGQPEFDGTDDFLTIAHHASQNFTGDFTIEAVFKPTGNAASCLMSKGSGNDYYQNYWLLCDTRSNLRQVNFIMANSSNNGAVYTTTDNSVITIGAYHHIVATVSGTTSSVYVNGVLEKTGTIPNRIQLTSDIKIGRRIDGFADSLGSQPVAKLYNTALTVAEINSNFNAYKNRFNI